MEADQKGEKGESKGSKEVPSLQTPEAYWSQLLQDWQSNLNGNNGQSALSPAHLSALSRSPQLAAFLQSASLMHGLGLNANYTPAPSLFKPAQPQGIPSTSHPLSSQQERGKFESSSLPRPVTHRISGEFGFQLSKRSKSELALGQLDEGDDLSAGRHSLDSQAGLHQTLTSNEKDDWEKDDSRADDGDEGEDGLQDDREVKKLRRKQSNRESARRSRLRKQRECEALSSSVTGLRRENNQLREENRSLQAKVEELTERISQGSFGSNTTNTSPQGPSVGASAFQPVPRRVDNGSFSRSLPPKRVMSNLDTLSAAAAIHDAMQS